jgi:hypothetical protein
MTKLPRDLRAQIRALAEERAQLDQRKREIARQLHAARVALKRAEERAPDLFGKLLETLHD